MKVDVVASRKPSGSAVTVARSLQLFRPPVLDPVALCDFENVDLRLAHRVTS
jgi:hypothetical protein